MKFKFTFLLAFIFLISLTLPTGLTAQDMAVTSSTEETVITEEVDEEMEEEEKEKAVSFSGSVDAYFRTGLDGDYGVAPATSFANLPGFALGMVNLVASHEGRKVGFTADLVVGPRGEDATFLSPALRPDGSSNIVNQLYAYWNVTEKMKVTIGNFNTFLGYEVISPKDNFNYSTTYLFSYGPFSHTGLKLDFDLGSGFSLMAGIFNPTDATEYNPGTVDEETGEISSDYVGGAQLGYEFDKGSVFLNTLVSDGFYQIDLTAGVDVTDAIYLGLNASSASDNFLGVAGYVQVAASDALKFGTRVEYFGDQGIGVTALDESILDFTLSANYTIGNLTFIPEFRIDTFSAADVDPISSLLLAAVYGF